MVRAKAAWAMALVTVAEEELVIGAVTGTAHTTVGSKAVGGWLSGWVGCTILSESTSSARELQLAARALFGLATCGVAWGGVGWGVMGWRRRNRKEWRDVAWRDVGGKGYWR